MLDAEIVFAVELSWLLRRLALCIREQQPAQPDQCFADPYLDSMIISCEILSILSWLLKQSRPVRVRKTGFLVTRLN